MQTNLSLDITITMNQRTHQGYFIHRKIMSKLEDNHSMRDVANEFRLAKSIMGQL